MMQMNLEKYKTLAERYTKALRAIAEEKNKVEKFSSELGEIVNTMLKNPDIKSFFVSPVIKAEDKKDVLQKSFENKTDDDIYNFLNILIDKNRMFLLESIEKLFKEKLSQKQNMLDVTAQTVIALNEDMKARLADKLSQITGKNINVINIIDKSIIGGVILKFDGTVIDGSVQTQLKRLQKQLI